METKKPRRIHVVLEIIACNLQYTVRLVSLDLWERRVQFWYGHDITYLFDHAIYFMDKRMPGYRILHLNGEDLAISWQKPWHCLWYMRISLSGDAIVTPANNISDMSIIFNNILEYFDKCASNIIPCSSRS